MDGEMNHSYVSFLVTCQIVWPRWEEGFGSRVSSWSLITHSRMVLLLTEVWCGLFKNKDRAHSRGWAAHVHSDHTEDHSCDFLTLMNLCLIWNYLAAVCADSRWRRFSICVRFLVMSFCSQAKTSHVGMFTAAILFDMYVLCWCFVIHFLTSLGLPLCLCHSSSHSHLSPVYISQIQTQKFKARQAWWQQPWQPVGLTFWEAAANLSLLNVYLLTSTLHELRPQERGRCCFMWVAGTLQHLQFITNTVQPKKVPQECNLLVQNKREICATVQNFALSNT